MAQYTQRTQPMHRHSKWLSKTFGDIGVSKPKCQTVCEDHIDPLFVRIIKQRKIFSEGESKKEASVPDKTKDPIPGPSGIAKPSSSRKNKRGAPKKSKVKLKEELETLKVEFIAVTGTPDTIKKETPEESPTPERLETAVSGKFVPRILKHSATTTVKTLAKKRARFDDTTQPTEPVAEFITSGVITSEVVIKDDPGSFESLLLPSIIYEDTLVKQEIPDTLDATERLNNDHVEYETCLLTDAVSNTTNAIQSQATDSQISNDFNVEIKVEKETDLVSKVKNSKEKGTFRLETIFVKEEVSPEISHNNSEHLVNKAGFHSIYEILNDLLEKKLISPAEKNILVSHKLELSLLQDGQCATFNPKLKSFAIALYVYSHKAYEYVRTNYKTCLPPPSTLRDWLVQPRGRPGFTRDTLEAINKKATKIKQQISVSHKIFVCLVLKDIEIAPSRSYRGPSHSATIINPLDWSVNTAKAAFVMSAVALNADWKVPIGYFWTNVVKGSERANLVKVAISILEAVGVEPVAVSFEYNDENLQMCTELNCSVDKTDLKTSFLSESGNSIFIFPDPNGILEVIYKDFNHSHFYVDESFQIVSLTQIPLLLKHSHDVQSVTWQHLLRMAISSEIYKNDFSLYVGQPLGTLTFLKNIHFVLDVLTSRKGGLKLKEAVGRSKVNNVTENPAVVALQGAGKYFKGLKFNDTKQPVWSIEKGRGILGLCALIDSALMLICKYSNQFSIQFGKFVGNSSYFLANLTPLGQNRKNATAHYFLKEYKAMLKHTDLLPRLKGNNLPIENISLLTCQFAVDIINLTTNLPNTNNTTHVVSGLWKLHLCGIPEFEDSFIVYLARFVTHSLINQLKCDICIRAIRSRPEKSVLQVDIKMVQAPPFAVKLEDPSIAAMNICKTAEAAFKKAIKHSGGEKLNPKFKVPFLLTKVMKKYVNRPLFENLLQHQFDTDPTCNHVVELTKAVAALYLQTRIQDWKNNIKKKQIKVSSFK